MELIKISNEGGKQTVNARELHKFLGSKQDFSTWIKKRIRDYDFIEGQDFVTNDKKVERQILKEYHISLDMAKELSMVERNDKGKEARRYFISCEKKSQAIITDPFILLRLNQIEFEKRLDRIEEVTEVLAIEEKRPLTKEEPPNGFANKGDVMKTVSGILGTTKSIVEQVLYFYEEDIETSQYAIEAMSADAIINVDVKCYRVTEVLKSVLDAIKNSKEVTACFSIFPTLGQKKLKVK